MILFCDARESCAAVPSSSISSIFLCYPLLRSFLRIPPYVASVTSRPPVWRDNPDINLVLNGTNSLLDWSWKIKHWRLTYEIWPFLLYCFLFSICILCRTSIIGRINLSFISLNYFSCFGHIPFISFDFRCFSYCLHRCVLFVYCVSLFGWPRVQGCPLVYVIFFKGTDGARVLFCLIQRTHTSEDNWIAREGKRGREGERGTERGERERWEREGKKERGRMQVEEKTRRRAIQYLKNQRWYARMTFLGNIPQDIRIPTSDNTKEWREWRVMDRWKEIVYDFLYLRSSEREYSCSNT